MSTNYPVSLDTTATTLPNPGAADVLNGAGNLAHHIQHDNANDAIKAIEQYLGTNASQTAPTVANAVLNSTSATAATWTTTPTLAGLTLTLNGITWTGDSHAHNRLMFDNSANIGWNDSSGMYRNVLTVDSFNTIQFGDRDSVGLKVVIPSSGGTGLQVGSPIGGDKGGGTINLATAIYLNGAAYTNPDFVFEHHYTGQIRKHKNKVMAPGYRGLPTLLDMDATLNRTYRLPYLDDIYGPDGKGHDLFSGSEAVLLHLEQAFLYLIDHEKRLRAGGL